MAQTIEIAKSMLGKEMLTLEETLEIRNNNTLNAKFKDVLQFGEWTYVRAPGAERRSLAAFLLHGWDSRLTVLDVVGPDEASRVVILKVGREAAAMKTPEDISVRGLTAEQVVNDIKAQFEQMQVIMNDTRAKLDKALENLRLLRQ